jgi:glycosyltransferase involved in cell wall biosynthesis
MTKGRVVISINSSWNIVNFRSGLIEALLHAGYEVVALAPEDGHSARFEELGVRFVPIAMDGQGVSPAGDLALLLRYRTALKRIRPDAFLGYTIKPNIWGSLAAQSLGISVINNVSGLGTVFIRRGILTRIAAGLYRLALRRSHTVFFQNPQDRALFVEKRIVAPERTALLPGSGINLTRFAPAPRPDGEGFVFLLVARLLRDKGIGEYVEAARMLRSRYPNAQFRMLGFLDVANPTAVSRAEVEAWASDGVIDYLGHAEDVRPVIAAADCVVLPSYREGLPRTLLEASAMAKPVIATDVPGCRHAVAAGVTGLLCAPRDAASLAEAMAMMLDMAPEARRAMGAAGRARAEAEFDEARVAAAYIEAIERALSPR